MKKYLIVVMLLVVSGCVVWAPPEVNLDVQQSAKLVDALNTMCQNGDADACKDGLNEANRTLQTLAKAMREQ